MKFYLNKEPLNLETNVSDDRGSSRYKTSSDNCFIHYSQKGIKALT